MVSLQDRSAIMVFTLGIFAWVSGNVIFSDYLNIMYIPNAGEITIFVAAFLGSTNWIFMVQHLPSTGLYGGYRELNHWSDHLCYRLDDSQRIVTSLVVRNFLNREFICGATGELF